MRQAGIVSQLITPFGVGDELMGIITAGRLHAGHWTDAEVGVVESIAADLGRGLHHARLYEEENRLVEELTAVDRAKSDFVATVSHELRTPLTSVTGYVEMLLDGDLGELEPEQERTLEKVNRNATRLKDLIEDLLTLSSMESGTFTMVTRPVNLLEIISEAVDDIAPAVSSKGLTLATTCPRDGLVVNGDSKQLVRVLANLLSNAVKFTLAGGHIDVSAEAAERLGGGVRRGYRHRHSGRRQEGSLHPLLPGLERDEASDSGYRSGSGHRPDDRRRPRR